MDQNHDMIIKNRYGIVAMWLTWVMSAGAIVIALLMTLVVNKTVYPAVCFLLALGLYICVRHNRFSDMPICSLLPFVMSKAFFWSALVMEAINMLNRHGYIYLFVTDVELLNPNLPYITILILSPAVAISCLWMLHKNIYSAFCSDCLKRNGTSVERGFLGAFYSQEGRYLLNTMMWLAIGCGLFAYGYYFFFYINASLNTPDKFVFDYAPSIILGLSILYMTYRYLGVWNYFALNLGSDASSIGRTTKVRFLVTCGEKMLLKIPDLTKDLALDDPRIDAPITLSVRRKHDVTVDDAEEYFRNITNLDDFKIRFIYSTNAKSSDSSIYHFLVTLPSEEIPSTARLRGEWFTLPEIDKMSSEHTLSPMLWAEMMRIHLITTAYKAYDERGYRRYEFKNYKPKFLLSELADNGVDYNDLKWLYISYNNQDKPFFRLRRFWSRYVSGSFYYGDSKK